MIVDDRQLSILMPAYNEGGRIYDNLLQTVKALDGRVASYELVVIDDGSRDQTAEQIQKAAKLHPSLIKPVLLPENRGKGAALCAGFYQAKGGLIAFLDSDLDLPPEQIIRFLDVMKKTGADAVIGAKRHPDSQVSYPWHRRLASSVYFSLVKLLLNLPLRDTQTGIKLFKREALENSLPRLLIKRFAFDLELLAVIHSQGFKITDAPVQLEFGDKLGCVTLSTVYRMTVDTLAIFYRTRLLKYYQSFTLHPLTNPPPTVSVVVAFAHYNPYVFEMLEGLKAQTIQPLEILLLPDAPGGHPLAGNVREIPTGCERPAIKRNLGIRESRGGIVAFLDDDTTPHPDWLETALSNFSDPSITAVGGPGINAHNDTFLQKIGGDIYSSRLCSGPYRYRYVVGRYREVDDYPSCNLLIRKSALADVGGFSTNYWPGEDTVLCLDLVKRGGKIVYDPRAVVEHHRRALFIPHLRQLGRYARHRGHFMKIFPETSLRLSYLLPSLFALTALSGGITIFISPLLFSIYSGMMLLYFAALAIALFSLNPAKLFLRVCGMFATHTVYGIGVLKGLLTGVKLRASTQE
ncbi:MAG: glycosyltransferase [Kiritimatiellales bacterium]